MKPETKHYYQKRIKELEYRNSKLQTDLYEFRSACSEIYNGIVGVMKEGKQLSMAYMLERLKRAWRS